MNRRLQQFLELEQMSPAKLADLLGIQRSGISHILSGRNKPGYDFLNKFILKFPAISSEWIITGKGKPYKEHQIIENTNDFSKNNSTSATPYLQEPMLFPDQSSDKEDDMPVFKDEYPPENKKFPGYEDIIAENKTVKRVMIFYSDGSYDEFYSQK